MRIGSNQEKKCKEPAAAIAQSKKKLSIGKKLEQ
jgi:hypothetical protein